MTGVLNAVVGRCGQFVYDVTVANIGGAANQYGYNDASVPSGAISPGTFRGQSVEVASCDGTANTGNSFNLSISGVLAQSFIQYVMVQRTTGAWVTFVQQDASSFISGPSVTIWQWGGGAPDAVWTSTSPSPRQIIICF